MILTALRCIALAGTIASTSCAARPPASLGLLQIPPAATAPDSADAIGSTRNSVVAFAMASPGAVQLTFLAGDLPDDELKRLADLAPNVKVIAGLTRDSALAHADEAHGVEARLLSPALVERATNLVWVQTMSAGVDTHLRNQPLIDNDRIILTNMRAVHGPAIADHSFAMLLMLTRNLAFYRESQNAGRWNEDATPSRSISLHGKTMLVAGIGGIGSEIAQRAHGFGMRVIATRRTDTPAPEYVERLGKPDDLLKMLPAADVVAICVPLTPETDHMFNAEAFAAMKPGAYLINIARGRIIDTDAMLAALRSGRLAGACLDVTDPEPLPADHALWKMPNVIITPHVASDAEVTEQRRWVLFNENMRRFAAGEPLLNVVDKKAGY